MLYSAFASRQALIDAVALDGFSDVAAALEAVDASPMARMRAYLDFAAAHPRVYEAMFSLPSGLPFAADDTPEPLRLRSRASTTHSRMPTAPGRRSPGRRCTAWPPSRPAGACARARRRPGSTSPTACSRNRKPADRHAHRNPRGPRVRQRGIYGTDVFGAIVLRPAVAAVDDRTLTQPLGHIHRIADRRPAIGAAGLIAPGDRRIAAASGHWDSAAAGALATLALVIFLAIYSRVSKPVNTALTAAALADRVPGDARQLQARWHSVIDARVPLQTLALATLCVALAAV